MKTYPAMSPFPVSENVAQMQSSATLAAAQAAEALRASGANVCDFGAGEPDFDRMYASMMVADHKKAVGLFEGFAKTATHSDLKAFASKTLPGLKAHLKHAEDLAKALGVKG